MNDNNVYMKFLPINSHPKYCVLHHNHPVELGPGPGSRRCLQTESGLVGLRPPTSVFTPAIISIISPSSSSFDALVPRQSGAHELISPYSLIFSSARHIYSHHQDEARCIRLERLVLVRLSILNSTPTFLDG